MRGPKKSNKRPLVQHLENIQGNLSSLSRTAGFYDHPSNLGSAREAIVSSFLRSNLPKSVDFWNGEILDSDDKRSGQLDIVVYSSNAPKLNLFSDHSVLLCDFAIAVIEVKSKLTTASWDQPSHLRSSLEACRMVKSLKRNSSFGGITGDGEVKFHSTPYIVFAFDGPEHEFLLERLRDFQAVNGIQINQLPDMIVNLSKSYYLVQNNGWLFRKADNVDWSRNLETEGTLLGPFAYIVKLIEAYNSNPPFMPFSAYLRDM